MRNKLLYLSTRLARFEIMVKSFNFNWLLVGEEAN